MSSPFNKLEPVYKLGLAFEEWIPHILVGDEIFKLGLGIESWISHLSVRDEKLEDWCLPTNYV